MTNAMFMVAKQQPLSDNGKSKSLSLVSYQQLLKTRLEMLVCTLLRLSILYYLLSLMQFFLCAMFTNCTSHFSLSLSHTVTNLRAVNTTTNSTTITWDQPPHNYRVFLHGEATDNIPQSRVIHLVNVTGQTTHNIGGLDSFRNYSIGVYLESDQVQGSN